MRLGIFGWTRREGLDQGIPASSVPQHAMASKPGRQQDEDPLQCTVPFKLG